MTPMRVSLVASPHGTDTASSLLVDVLEFCWLKAANGTTVATRRPVGSLRGLPGPRRPVNGRGKRGDDTAKAGVQQVLAWTAVVVVTLVFVSSDAHAGSCLVDVLKEQPRRDTRWAYDAFGPVPILGLLVPATVPHGKYPLRLPLFHTGDLVEVWIGRDRLWVDIGGCMTGRGASRAVLDVYTHEGQYNTVVRWEQ
jgi:hypothetical protein